MSHMNPRLWPVIRHIRYLWYLRQVNRHYANWRRLGYLPVNSEHDYEILDQIWKGER